MSGFMNRFYYGRAGQADYTQESLPENRWQLFFEMLKVRFSALMGVNLFYLGFCVPALIWTLINVAVVVSTPDAMQATDVLLSGVAFTYLLGMIPCLGLAGIGATGEMYILRNWARDQHAFLASDFKDTIKSNWKYGLFTGLINGFSLFTAWLCYTVYGQMAQGAWGWMIPQMVSVMLAIVWWMMNPLLFPMMVTYDLKYLQLLRNSLIMVLARLPWAFLLMLGSVGLPALIALFIPYGWVVMVGVYLIIGFALTGFIYASFANACFDRYLNPRIEGAQVGRGLREVTEDFQEEDDESEEPV